MKIDSMCKQRLIACFIFGLVAVDFSFFLLPWQGWSQMIIATGIAAFLSTFLLWKKLILQHPHPSIWRGALVGALISILSYPISWYLVLLYSFFTGATDSLGEKTVNPLESIAATFIMSFASFVFSGWLTVPIGAIVGIIVTVISKFRP